MKITIDTDHQEMVLHTPEGAAEARLPLYSDAGFALLSDLWLKVGWNQKYSYTFTWLGRPVIQLPEDMLRTQEVICKVQPDVIVETGVAHGGSLLFYASLCQLLGRGRVIGVDLAIRSHNRQALQAHPQAERITLVEGSSVDPEVVARVRGLVAPGERVLVLLDSNHSHDHVLAELHAYAPLVAVGSYIVATDGIMRELHDVPRGRPEWRQDNPARAAEAFAAANPAFRLEQPAWAFNESGLSRNLTYWPSAWLKRVAWAGGYSNTANET